MASTLLINPRQALRALEKAGIPKDQANEIVKIFEDIDISHLATKQDLQTELQKLRADFIQFMFLQALTIVGLTVTIIKFL